MIKSITSLTFVALVALPVSVAKAGCPAGIPSGGNPMCLPPSAKGSPYYRDVQAPRSRYIDRWGALAIDPSVRGAAIAFSVDMSSERLARKSALKKCAENGGAKCMISTVFRNGCGVIAWGTDVMQPAVGPDVEEASRIAMRGCANSTTDCEIMYSACSFPVLVD